MHRIIALLVACAAAWAASPRITNAKLETRQASGAFERQFRALSGESGPVWIIWEAASMGSQFDGRCSYRLEGRRRQDGHGLGESSSASDLMLVLVRVANGRVGEVSTAPEDCELDAGGVRVVVFEGVRTEESVAVLEPLAEPEAHVRDGAILAVAQHSGVAAERAMERLAAPARSKEMREKAVFWLGAARGESGAALLRKILREDASDFIREKAVFALSISKANGAIDDLIAVARHDSSARVRSQAYFWLGHKAGEKAEGAIRDAIDHDPDASVKTQAVFALSQMPKERGVPLLIETAKTNRNAEVRKSAMFWLGQSKDERALAFFEQLLKQ